MKDKLKRKSNDESNKMLRNPDEIYKKTIQDLKKKYGYTSKQIVIDFEIPQDFESLSIDLAVFSKDDDKNPKIIGEVKIGNFVFPFAEYQLKKYMKASNAKYGFLTNGKEWINYESTNNSIIRTSNIPTSKELKLILSGKKIDKEFLPISGADYILKKLSTALWQTGHSSTEVFLQLISLKLYDENHENNQNFKKIANYPETYLEVFQSLWDKFDKKFPNTFASFQLTKEHTHNILPEIIEFSNFSLIKSNSSETIKYIIIYLHTTGSRKGWYSGTPKLLIKFLFDLLKLSNKDKIVVPYSGPETLAHLLDLLDTNFPKTSKENIVTMESMQSKIQILHIISELNLPKFQIFRHDPIFSPMLQEFNMFDHVIAVPPFGERFVIPKSENSPQMDLGQYGNESIHYFVKRLISSFKQGTKISLVVPQGFLFNSNSSYRKIRKEILERCTIHGIIQLPQGFFNTTAIQTSLLLLEMGLPHKDKYEIFMSVYPKTSTYDPSHENIIKKIIDDFHTFQKGNLLKEPNQNGFVVGINEIIDNGWTVTNKVPEFKQMLDIPDKQHISDVVDIVQGTNLPPTTVSDGKILPFIRISDLENNSIKSKVSKSVILDDNSISKYKKYLIKEGDILLSSKGTIGKVAIVEKKYEGSIASSQLFIIRSKTKIIPEYLLDCLNSKITRKQIQGIIRGATIPFLPISEFIKIIISVPSLSLQKEKISKSMKLQYEISELEKILSQKRLKLQEYRDNE